MALQHAREPREVRLQPVLLGVLARGVLQVADHLVEVFLQRGHLALRFDRDRARQVALGHRGRHLGDRAHLRGEVGGEPVHVVGEVVPGSRRAPLVTCSAKVASVSIMPLMVSASAATSPFASTASLRLRSPLATAVTTVAMPRTCDVRLAAIEFTLAVRSFQTPPTPLTSAAKALSWSTMVLTVSFSSRISPFTSTVILRDRSPFATAVVTSAMLRTWAVRLPAMEFTESVKSFHVPATPCTSAWPPSLPSVPTSRATRVTSAAKLRSWSTIVLIVFFSSRISPFTSTVILRERSPACTALVTSAMLRTWDVRFDAIEFTDSVRSFHVPATPFTSAWPPSRPSVPTSRATRVTSEAKLPSWSTITLIVFLSSRISPFTSTVILRVRSPAATALVTSAMLRTWAVRLLAMKFTFSVRSFHVPTTPGTWA